MVGVSCGEHHSLAVDDLGTVYAWGRNREGQCGQGLLSNFITSPHRVEPLLHERVIRVPILNSITLSCYQLEFSTKLKPKGGFRSCFPLIGRCWKPPELCNHRRRKALPLGSISRKSFFSAFEHSSKHPSKPLFPSKNFKALNSTPQYFGLTGMKAISDETKEMIDRSHYLYFSNKEEASIEG